MEERKKGKNLIVKLSRLVENGNSALHLEMENVLVLSFSNEQI